jgi:hypothetical protein
MFGYRRQQSRKTDVAAYMVVNDSASPCPDASAFSGVSWNDRHPRQLDDYSDDARQSSGPRS